MSKVTTCWDSQFVKKNTEKPTLQHGILQWLWYIKTACIHQKTWQNSVQLSFIVIEHIHIFLKAHYTKKFNEDHLMNMYVLKE